MKHTKGPWELQPVTGGYRIITGGKYTMNLDGPWYPSIPQREAFVANAELIAKAPEMYKQLASARAIMQKFVDKVDRGMARSIETYAEMKQWMEEE